MSLTRDEDHCCYISGTFTLVSSLSVCYHRFLLVPCICNIVLCVLVRPVAPPHHFTVGGPVRCTLLSVHSTLSTLVSPYVVFYTELRANSFVQGGIGRQLANDGADTTTSEDKV